VCGRFIAHRCTRSLIGSWTVRYYQQHTQRTIIISVIGRMLLFRKVKRPGGSMMRRRSSQRRHGHGAFQLPHVFTCFS
jgi:hypothetical protein